MFYLKKELYITLSILFLLAGCMAKQPERDEAVKDLEKIKQDKNIVADGWSAANSGGLVDDQWLKTFNDPTLIALVDEAQQNNFGLKIASAQVDKANSLNKLANSSLKPTVGLSGGYADRNTENLSELYGGGLTISWEADVWGRLRSGVSAADESAAATRSDYESARQSLAAAVANSWFLAIGSKMLADYADDIAGLLEKSLNIAETKERVGQGNMKDVHMARAQLANAKQAARQALAAKENAQRGLELLLGRYPAGDIESADELVAVPPPVATDMPSSLLERRPDIVAAEQRVAAAFYKKREAELLHLPRFTFSAGVGVFNLTDAASTLAAGIFAPLYTGGAIEAEVDQATAEQKEAIALYAEKALAAFGEVEAALAAEDHLQQQEVYLKTVVEENYKAYSITEKQYEVGKVEYLSVLLVREKWIQAKIAEMDIATRRLVNRVGLHLALGGSFD